MSAGLSKHLMHLLAGLAAVAIAGCATPQLTAVNYYGLTPVAERDATASPRPARAPLLLVIQDVRLPQYLDRPQIVARTTGNSLLWSDERRWAEPLRDELRRVLAMNLGRLLPGVSAVLAPHAIGDRPALRLEVEIRRFERAGDGRIVLDAQWWADGVGGQPAIVASTVLLAGATADAADGEALAAGMSAVYGDFARHIAERLYRTEGVAR